ncbi:BOS complex subunit NCLN [Arctopsyche grandis]|uniref:BOS complex subunit NCLN n=1 Tax=Arctopsyche grandis TaxID=121162 RepID=UPI00406D8D28
MCMEEAAEAMRGMVAPLLPLLLALTLAAAATATTTATTTTTTTPQIAALRLHQHDLHAVTHGCRSASVNLEARSLTGWSTSRHCVLARLQEITIDQFLDIRAKAGALLALLPRDIDSLSLAEKEHLVLLENAMSAQDISIPVYFVPWSSHMNSVINDLSVGFKTDDKSNSAVDALINLALANGYQIVVGAPGIQKQESKVVTLHGQLAGQEIVGKSDGSRDDSKLPTVAIVAHYDAAAVAPELAFGADSNASGVSVLLELARIFSQLYSSQSTRGPVNLVFLLTGGAHMNYYSTKKWIEDQLDSVEGSIIQDASFVLCLDSLASDASVIMHVSKPPKEGSPTNLFYNQLKQAAALQTSVHVDGIHKKINLADENLAWEHERFSIRRLPAFTLSALKSHKSLSRTSILDNFNSINIKTLAVNTQIIADALAGYLYNISASDYNAMFSGSLKVDKSSLESWMQYMTSQPRATQFASQASSPLVVALSDALGRYLPDLASSVYIPDKRDPEFVTYTPTSAPLNIYNVKPAVFDLILTVVITMYLGVVYLFILKFSIIYSQVCKMSLNNAVKSFKSQ